MKKSNKLLHIVTASLFAALCCVATMIMQIPTPTGGFVNLGDTIIIFAAFILSPVYAALAAGIGSGLADILAGYVQYTPATFIIKALMALVACFMLSFTKKHFSKDKAILSLTFTVIAAICAEAIMISGYYLFEAYILGYGAAGAFASVLPNAFQGIAGIIGGTLLCEIMKHTKLIK